MSQSTVTLQFPELNASDVVPPLRRAMTLIDIIVTMSILAVISAIAIPNFSASLEGIRVKSLVRRVETDMHYARESAIAMNTQIKVEFNVDKSQVKIKQVSDLNHPNADYTVDLVNDYGISLVDADFDGKRDFSFNSYGDPDSAGILRFSSGSQEYELAINGAGTISVNSVLDTAAEAVAAADTSGTATAAAAAADPILDAALDPLAATSSTATSTTTKTTATSTTTSPGKSGKSGKKVK